MHLMFAIRSRIRSLPAMTRMMMTMMRCHSDVDDDDDDDDGDDDDVCW